MPIDFSHRKIAVPEVKRLYEGDQRRLLNGSQSEIQAPAAVQIAAKLAQCAMTSSEDLRSLQTRPVCTPKNIGKIALKVVTRPCREHARLQQCSLSEILLQLRPQDQSRNLR